MNTAYGVLQHYFHFSATCLPEKDEFPLQFGPERDSPKSNIRDPSAAGQAVGGQDPKC